MSAGLPGLGLGGLFFILSALFAPIVELVRTARGQSSAESWLHVGRQFTLALLMIVAVDATLRLIYVIGSAAGIGSGLATAPLTVLPLLPIAFTAGLLGLVLAGAKGMALTARARTRGLPAPPPLPSGGRLAGGTLALAGVWLAMLALGASGLSPLSALAPPGGSGGAEEAHAGEGAGEVTGRGASRAGDESPEAGSRSPSRTDRGEDARGRRTDAAAAARGGGPGAPDRLAAGSGALSGVGPGSGGDAGGNDRATEPPQASPPPDRGERESGAPPPGGPPGSGQDSRGGSAPPPGDRGRSDTAPSGGAVPGGPPAGRGPSARCEPRNCGNGRR